MQAKSSPSLRNSIGIFDSGVGGLTVMRAIIDLLPNEDLIYFGDTARLPYGGKSPSTIIRYATENTIFLMEKNIKMLVIACNTASSYAVEKLQAIFNIPVIGVIEPGVEAVIQTTRSARIGILGTKATIGSESYQKAIMQKLPHAALFPVAAPLLVHLVEELLLDHEATKLIIQDYLQPLVKAEIDTLMLGCTHYPLLTHLVQKELGCNVAIVDSATICALEVKRVLQELQLFNEQEKEGKRLYYVSDDPKKFQSIGRTFLGLNIDNVELIPIAAKNGL